MIRLQNKINRYIILLGMILCAFVLVLGCSLIIIFYHFAVNIYITFALSLVLITFLRDYYYVCRTIWIS
ncbi:transmembrane protein, putative [Medicago truncatula]|uniref:Transmembrane protein, putative n=1 Tax=Medicago truncatula TaxID=3880 RepID=G7K1T6_MEDTR|nr:transmembrane protein, putative [Medicago truncatula]